MSFTSPEFIGLVLLCTAVYYIFPKKLSWLVLLAASCCFYASAGKQAALFLGLTVLTTWTGGLLAARFDEKKHRKLVVLFVCLINFGLLALLKYAKLGLVAPLGLSFYIFQSTGYVIDCSKKKQVPEKNPLKYALFVSFFPQMVQGPVSRYGQLVPQLLRERKFDARKVKFGIELMMWGYLKKLVIADRAAVASSEIFSNYTEYGGAYCVFAVLLYSVQIYCDFSGGIDITRGAAEMLGIDMAENFRRPLFAQSLAEYWRRWHISLGSWMKDYVFYPLVLSKPFVKLGSISRKRIKGRAGKLVPAVLATFVVYFIIGVWHGAGMKYMVFGLWNGAIISLSQLTDGLYTDIQKKLHLEGNPVYAFYRMLRTFVLVFIGRYFSRADGVMPALSMLKRSLLRFDLAEFKGGWLGLGLELKDYIIIASGVMVLLIVEIYEERSGRQLREWLEERGVFVQWLFMVVPLVLLYFLGIDRGDYIAPEFIYKQF